MNSCAIFAVEHVRSAPPGIMQVVLHAITHQPILVALAVLGIGAWSMGDAA